MEVDWKGSQYLSLEGYTVSKSACRNGQSAALLSDSGLVMYFSTLPAPSSSAPCILAILTHLHPQATPGDSRWQGKISLEGYTPAKMAAEPQRHSRAPTRHSFPPTHHSCAPICHSFPPTRHSCAPICYLPPEGRHVYRPRGGMFTARGTVSLPPVGR